MTDLLNVEKEYKQVQADLKNVSDDLKSYAEKSQKEISNHTALSAETKANVDKLLVQQGELQARLQSAEQLVAKLDSGELSHGHVKSMGEQFISVDGFEAFASSAAAGKKGSFSHGVKATVTSVITGGNMVQPQRAGLIVPGQRRLTIRDLLSWGRTTSNSVEFVRETGFTNNAAPVSENPTNVKPESDLTFELDSAPVATIAHWIRASKQVLADVSMLASYIDGRLRYGLALKEEAQLLNGSGVGLNISGLYTEATAYSNPGVAVQAETAIDRLRLALLQVTLAEYDADGIVLSPIDWAAIELTKTQDDAYLFASPTGLAVPGLWGRPVVATQSMSAGDFLVGSFQQAAQGWDREDISVTVSTEDRDNFVKNMVTILCENRVALSVYRPEALVKGDFDGVLSSI
jgi:HK97 family phage major capsid protein